MRVLVVDDDEAILNVLAEVLRRQNYAVEVATDGETAWQLLESFPVDLLLLDVMLPDLNGLELCQRVRSQGYQIPILLLTSRDSSHDKAIGLDAGADDYLIKPFDPEELTARVRALLRRGANSIQPILSWDQLKLDPGTCQVTYDNKILSLTPKEYALLELFLRNPRRVFSCGSILEHVWAYEDTPGEDAVRTHIKGLRQKLKAAGAPADVIDTVYGLGYRLKFLEKKKETRDRNQEAMPLKPRAQQDSKVLKGVRSQESEDKRDGAPNSVGQSRQQMLAAIAGVWDRFKPRIVNQVAVLEQAAAALQETSPETELQQQALREAHTLAGSLGTFGLMEGSALARQIEQQLKSFPLSPDAVEQVVQWVAQLRQQIDAPLPPHPAAQVEQQTSTPPVLANILAVDDDPALLEALVQLLEPWGFVVTGLTDPRQIWQQLDQVRPALLILDLHMPHLDGLELCQAIRDSDRWGSLPILVLTADTDAEIVNQVFGAGADDFVTKPLVGPELVTRLLNRLERVRLLQRLNQAPTHRAAPTAKMAATDPQEQKGQFFQKNPELCCILSLDGQFLQINQAFQQVMGVGVQGLVGRSWSEIGHPEDQTEIAAALQQLQRGQAVAFEARCSALKHSYCWLEWHAIVDSDVIYAIGHDITDRRQQEQKWRKSRDEFELRVAERTAELVSLNQILQHELDSVRKLQEERNQVEMALRFSQARFAGILEIADDAIISVNQAQQITLFNQGAEKIFGYTSAEVLNQPLDILLPSALASIHRQHVRDFAASSGEARRMGERRAIFGRRKDGSEFPAEASISCLNLGEERLFTVILRDSTERQRAQDALQQSEERLRLLLDGVEDYAIFMLDPSGHVESWNPGAEKVQGYQAKEIIGQDFACFFLPDDRTSEKPAAILEQALQEGRLEVEGWRLRADGSRFYADTVITALKDGNGKLRGFTEITRDITDARQREAERQAIERMKDEFVSMVSHELRTPLTSIHGSLRMLSSGLLKADTDRSQRLLQIASDSTDRLVRLINDILDLERIESGKVSLVKRVWNLADLIAEAVDGMQAIADKAGIRLSVTTIAVDVYVDRDRIIQTLTNLLSNAIKFSPKESIVQIRIERSSTISRRSTKSKEKKTNRSKASALLVTVQDQGRGIPPDKLETIFERFQQVDASDSRHQDGTGLGLAICRSIINQHGGQIWATSVLGEGSAFYFTLPLQRQEPERT